MTDEQAAALRAALARQVESIPLEVVQEMFRRLDAKAPEASICCHSGINREDGKPVAGVVLKIEPQYLIAGSDTVIEFPNGTFIRLRSPEVGGTGEVEVKDS